MEEDSISLESTSIVLVGLCNEEIRLQSLLGMVVFYGGVDQKLEPRLIDVFSRPGEYGSSRKPFKPTFQWMERGRYGLCFPDVAKGHGLMINLDKPNGKYSFITGINSRDSGSSGPLSNGGPELVDALDELFNYTAE